MRSLYAKVLLLFIGTIFITFAGFVIVNRLSFRDEPPPPQAKGIPGRFLGRTFFIHFAEARRLFEADGAAGLTAFLEELQRTARLEAHLTDATGRDLADGQDRSTLRALFADGRRFPVRHEGRLLMGRPSEDGRYWFFEYAPDRRPPPLFVPGHLWVIGSALVFGYFLVRHLRSPLRSLQQAVERFGRGDFSARVNSDRRDELGRLARAFDLMAERIETLVAAERRLLVDLSHELRSPLTRLGLAVELARAGPDRDTALDRIQREADRLNELVGGLLQVTRAEVDPGALHSEPCRLDALVSEAVEDCRFDAQARRCTIETNLAGPVRIHADVEALRRAIENVLRNAIRYSPPAEKISVELRQEASQAVVVIRDRGPGVPEESLPFLFEPFYQAEGHAGPRGDGFGLGLSIARRAVQLHKGIITAANARPGLVVTIQLPVAV